MARDLAQFVDDNDANPKKLTVPGFFAANPELEKQAAEHLKLDYPIRIIQQWLLEEHGFSCSQDALYKHFRDLHHA